MKYFLIGIKGSGMSALALILDGLGHEVSGSDIEQFVFTQSKLETNQIKIYRFDECELNDYDVIIYGNSFDTNFSELKKALQLNKECIRYTAFLGQLVSEHHSICVAGTHGKTTTTGMAQNMLSKFADTGYLIGDGEGYLTNTSRYFVVESCEYQDNFLNYYPDYVMINNIELDHVDYFANLDDYILSFEKFASHAKKAVIVFADDENIQKMKIERPVYSYGFHENATLKVLNSEFTSSGITFSVRYRDKDYNNLSLPFYGKHMLLNSLSVILLGLLEGYDILQILESLVTFRGVNRRFNIELVGQNVLIDDYAHHPTAVNLMIDTCRQKYPDKPVVAIFKPDRYSRLEQFLQEFKTALSKADYVYLCDFASNILPEPGVNVKIEDLANIIPNCKIISQDSTGAQILSEHVPATFLFMSSKNIYELKDHLAKLLQK